MMSSLQSTKWGILVLFFISGAPALLYQIIWQHHLYTIYGAHAESVAIIVGAFMFGLGIGSLVGGEVSARWKSSPFYLFAIIETLIGLFGYFSLSLFDAVGSLTTNLGVFGAGVVVFLLIVIPTTAMGATLPILANALIARLKNVGVSVGNLYFVNTLGSACAAAGSVYLFAQELGQHGIVFCAVGLNVVVVLASLLLSRITDTENDPKAINQSSISEELAEVAKNRVGNSRQRLIDAAALSFFSGFISLSVEILWFRLLFQYYNGRAFVFPFTLAFFLLGIAIGSIFAARLMSNFEAEEGLGGTEVSQLKNITARIMLISGVAITLAFWSAGYLVTSGVGALLFLTTTILAIPLGLLFPFLMHKGVLPGKDAGRSVSRIYAANILGSTIGSIGTGFILLDTISLRGIVFGLGGLSAVLTLFLIRKTLKPLSVAYLVLAVVFMFAGYRYNDTLYERLQLVSKYSTDSKFVHTVENKSGVITVSADRTVYGTGVYDGKYNTDLVHDVNYIIRPYSLTAFHPNPKRILVIGLSSGSWAQVLANLPNSPEVDILEINPGYLKLIPHYNNVASLLTNPRVHIIIEDGRRYLVRNPNEKYDAIVMNTSFFWRAGATNLLSRDFLEILRKHLNQGGVVMYNTTSSEVVYKTGMTTFPYGWRVVNSLVLSDSPISIDRERLLKTLAEYRIDGKTMIDTSTASGTETLEKVSKEFDPLQTFSSTTILESRELLLSQLTPNIKILTDDNMLVEWQKHN